MLKCLELNGFKSFADATRLEFGDGLTAIVGPNGSGKSNLVDAIRWVLGEQSAKSMRGQEMADVIFNGSATRRSLGMAEASLTLDNRRRALAVDSDDVVITRRVYRDGEGEYLINGQIARLRDVRDLFLGTGAAGGAYSVIEQGKVDLLLQASTRDRRHIFEEAAGTSRFRIRKSEAARRLERIEQNLLRVQDIRDEVDKHVKGLRSQAGKARKFQEYAERLRELRLTLGRWDFDRLRGELTDLDGQIEILFARIKAADDDMRHAQTDHDNVEATLVIQEESIREVVEQIGQMRQRASVLEAELAGALERDLELGDDLELRSQRLRALQSRSASTGDQLAQTQTAREAEENGIASRRAALEQSRSATAEWRSQLAQCQSRLVELRRQSADALQAVASIENEQATLGQSGQHLLRQRARCTEKANQLARHIVQASRQESVVHQQTSSVRNALRRSVARLAFLKTACDDAARKRDQKAGRLAALHEQRIETQSRIDVLEQLQRRMDGLDGGVRTALEQKAVGDSAWNCVIDAFIRCIRVAAEHADAIELALGVKAQALVLRDADAMCGAVLEAAQRLPGRVQFVPLDAPRDCEMLVVDERIHWPPLSSWVHCDEALRPLVERLLGTTFMADDFASARQASEQSVGLRFLTPTGEILEPDGSVTAGPARSPSGILSRAAELRDLRHQTDRVHHAIASEQASLTESQLVVSGLAEQLAEWQQRHDTLVEQSRMLADIAFGLRQLLSRLHTERAEIVHELHDFGVQLQSVERRQSELDRQVVVARTEHERVKHEVSTLDRTANEGEEKLAAHESLARSIELDLAIAYERFAALDARSKRLSDENAQQQSDFRQEQTGWEIAHRRREALSSRLLRDGALLAELYKQREDLAAMHNYNPGQIEALRRRRMQLADRVRLVRSALEQDRETLHAQQLRATELRLSRDALASRVAEEYGIYFAAPDFVPGALTIDQPDAWRIEIDDLRNKLAKLGSVNLQAMDELNVLERRLATLDEQLNDLAAAKRHLQMVITRINEESQRLFLDTFQSVRGHFQTMIRKLFGGGKADLVLEDENDVLDCGIEIIARPPGKEPKSISLLSGGEKTLAAVALLLALFRARPSPFCILDEVDAALDEANIGRFIDVVREILVESQVILITHSKSTMASASVLHGITQREAGVSIRVSVRLEDVSDDGTIAHDANEAPRSAAVAS